MKKRKPPIALMSVLVLSVLGLAIASGGWRFYGKTQQEQAEIQQQEAMDKARANSVNQKPSDNSKVDLDKEVGALTASAKGASQAKSAAAPADEHAPKTAPVPTVVMPDERLTKPQKNPTAPSSQWYPTNK